MVAVLAVVVNHISPSALPGGFVGVDVFFVVSGFLITGRLLRTAGTESAGSYFGTFYKLRARRILPAAIVTIIATVVLGQIIFFGDRADSIKTDAIWALLFAANWHFQSVGTNYFNQDQATSPLQHYWSLAVEEQFYIVWPIVVLLVTLWQVRRTHARPGRAVGLAALAVIVLSLLWGWHQTATAPTYAYFSTLSRAWELALGAFLATLPAATRRLADARWATAWSWIGMLIVGAAVVATPAGEGFPVPGAIPAVVGSAIVVYAGQTIQPRNFVLRNPVSVWIGDLSYSIYLVHFPIWIYVSALIPEKSVYLYGTVTASTAAAAVASYYFVEEPGRRGLSALLPGTPAGRRRVLRTVTTCAAVTGVSLALIAFRPAVEPSAAVGRFHDRSLGVHMKPDRWVADPGPELSAGIRRGLKSTSWGEISNINSTGMLAGCSNFYSMADACHWEPKTGKDPSKVVLLMGDSIMHSWLPMMSKAFTDNGWSVVSIAQGDCFSAYTHYADTLQPGAGGSMQENVNCDKQHAFFPEALATVKPTLVVLDNMSHAAFKVSDGKGHPLPHDAQAREYKIGLKKTIHLAQDAGAKVLALSTTPEYNPIEKCRVAGSSPQNCITGLDSRWYEIRKYDVEITQKTGAMYGDLQNFYCRRQRCPIVIDGLKVVSDGHHITQEFAKYLADPLADYLRSRGIFG